MVALIESRRRSERMGKGMVVSVAVHSGIVALLLGTTGQVEAVMRPGGPGEAIIYIDSSREQVDASEDERGEASDSPMTDALDVVEHTEFGDQPMTNVLFEVALDVSRPELPTVPLDIEGLLRTRTAGERSAPRRPPPSGGEAVPAEHAERLPAVLRPPVPIYPAVLRDRAIEGAVLAEFTIDLRGLVQAASIRILASDHSLFEEEVRRALALARYRPAGIAGRPVAVVVRQRFAFKLER